MPLREQLLRDEGGIQLKPYRDSVGKLTIGCGRNLDDKGISRAEALFMFENDLQEFTASVRTALPWSEALDEVRRAVLVNMAFNLGIAGLLGFRRMLAAAQAGDWTTAAAELLDGPYKDQVGLRAHRLAKQLKSGEWI